MLLIREIRLLDVDCALRLIFDAEVVVVHHPDCQMYRVFLEVYDQAVAVEVAVLIFVHLDTLVAVCALIDDAILLERILDLVFVCVARQVANVDGAVLLNLGLLVGLLRMSEGPVVWIRAWRTRASCALLRFLLAGSACTFSGVSEGASSASVRGLSMISCVIAAMQIARFRWLQGSERPDDSLKARCCNQRQKSLAVSWAAATRYWPMAAT